MMSGWALMGCKFIAFFNPSHGSADASSIWHELYQAPPQTFQILQGPQGQSIPNGTQASGLTPVGAGTLTVQPGRLELGLAGVDANPSDPFSIATLGDAKAAMADGIKRMVKLSQAVVRIGVVGDAIHRAGDIDEANRILMQQVEPLNGVPAGSRDLSFTLNRPTSIEGLDVNRLGRWGIGSQQHFQFNMLAGAGAAMGMPPGAPPGGFSVVETHFANFTCDMNTVPLPNATPLPGVVLSKMWGALADEAVRALSNGYAHFND
jgi:hypothetical protein